MIGQTLSHYRITAKLGEGGMGEVYRAEDARLDREVALKILPPELAGSQERLERFQREAKTLAALDHPNIVTIYSVEDDDGIHFLTMQLVVGKRLSDLIPMGGMPLDRLFEVAIPLAEALTAAHEKGIVHRDLKPGNVMMGDDGRVRVLDFGLAKLRYDPDGVGATELPTEPLTDEGRVLGTVPYMSPEQVEGKPLDHRSDLFSFGVLLYEMSTGRRPFQGDSAASTMSAILRDTPPWILDLNSDLPRDLAKIVRRCLVKQPERRFQTARELAIELEELHSEVASGEAWAVEGPPTPPTRISPWAGWAAAGVILVAALSVVLWISRPEPDAGAGGSVAETATFTNLVFDPSEKGKVSASPDGRFFAYASNASGNWDIYLQRIAGGKAINLTADSPADDHQPAFSRDGEWIAFRSEREGGGIFIMGATGESTRRVTEVGFHPDWSPDGEKLVYSTSASRDFGRWVDDVDQRISTVDLSTGVSSQVVDHSALMPVWSPDGKWIAYYGSWRPTEAEPQQYDLFTVAPEGGEPRRITEGIDYERSPAWSADGRSLYFVTEGGGTADLWRVAIDGRSGGRSGQPVSMTSGSQVAYVSASSEGGRVLFTTRNLYREIVRSQFDPVARRTVASAVSITPPGLQAREPSVSPDGEWVAFSAQFGHFGSWAIGIVRRDGTDLRRVTDSGYRDLSPDWSPDGERLAFQSNRSGTHQIWFVNPDGGELQQLTSFPDGGYYPKWSPDGRLVSTCSGRAGFLVEVGGVIPVKEPSVQLRISGSDDGWFCGHSWSPDGSVLLGDVGPVTRTDAISLYSLESGTFRMLPTCSIGGAEAVQLGVPKSLNDGTGILFLSDQVPKRLVYQSLADLDAETGECHPASADDAFASLPPGEAGSVEVSPDNREIFLLWAYADTVISMMTVEEQDH